MEKIDDIVLSLARYQANLFELSVTYLNCSSAYFYKKYMNSDLAKRINNRHFIFESLDPLCALDELKKEKDLACGNSKCPSHIMHWIGYILSVWSHVYKVDTKFLYRTIKLNELERIYEAYHSLDVLEAIERIGEAKQVKYISDVKNQIEIIRKARAK